MGPVIQQIQTSLLNLLGQAIEAVPSIVRYWTLPEKAQARRTKTRAVVAIKATCDRAEIKIPLQIKD